jgi:hypothetical protein
MRSTVLSFSPQLGFPNLFVDKAGGVARPNIFICKFGCHKYMRLGA